MAILPKTNLSLANLHLIVGGVSGTTVSLNDPDIRNALSSPDYFYAGGALTAAATTDIFNNLQRFSHNTSGNFPASTVETGNNNWTKDSDNVGIKCVLNSNTYVGFVSPSSQAQDNFFMQAEVTTVGDNDVLSIVVAYFKDTAGDYGTVGNEYTISAIRMQNLLGGAQASWSLMYNYFQSDNATLKTSVDPNKIVLQNSNANWNTFSPLPGTVIQVIREGDTIRCKSTDAGSTTLKDELVYTLSGVAAKFSGPQQYGFGTLSQPALFDNIIIAETEAAAAGFNMGINGTAGSPTALGRYRNGTY